MGNDLKRDTRGPGEDMVAWERKHVIVRREFIRWAKRQSWKRYRRLAKDDIRTRLED